jgi:phosphoribosylanthranilate isomerase
MKTIIHGQCPRILHYAERSSIATRRQGSPDHDRASPQCVSAHGHLGVEAVLSTSYHVKVCGLTNVEDAATAAEAGATLLGMIMWPKAKRSIDVSIARQISAAARRHGAEPVAVFVDEHADEIARVCGEADIGIAQLHGDGARKAAGKLPCGLRSIYVMHANNDGILQTEPPRHSVDWLLMDSLQGGSGERFEWSALTPPVDMCSEGWLLAGGLNPQNVMEAILTARPTGVDVSSGVCGPDGLKKDRVKVTQYIKQAKLSFESLHSQRR